VLGIPIPHARTGGVLIVAHRRLEAHCYNILRGSAKPPTSTGESPYYLEIEKGLQYIYVEEEDYIHSTQLINSFLLHLQLLQWQQGCCHCSSLSLHSLAHTHVLSLILLSHNASIYRHFMAAVPLVLLSNMAARLGMVGCLTIENGGCQ